MILFNFINIFAIFQAYINKALADLIDINYIAYFNDILIYSSIYAEYQQHIRQVLERLRQYKLYAKLSKYEFSIILIIFFGFVINIGEIEMNMKRVKIIAE
jgi:hypothetical protein